MHPFSMYNLVSFDMYYPYNHHLNQTVEYFQRSRKFHGASLPSFSSPTPPGNHSSDYLLNTQEFVVKYFATHSEGVCNKISWLVFIHRPLFQMESPVEEHVSSSHLVTVVTDSPLSLLLQVRTLKE